MSLLFGHFFRSVAAVCRGGLSPSPAVSQSEQSVSCHHFLDMSHILHTSSIVPFNHFIWKHSFNSRHSIRFNTRLDKITTSSAVYEFGCCLNFYQMAEYCNNLRHIHIRYVRGCSIDNLYTYSFCETMIKLNTVSEFMNS